MLLEGDLVKAGNSAMNEAGRFCPLDYTISSNSFKASSDVPNYDLVYIVGGLYGNTCALEVILAAFAKEPFERKQLVFNGDFHWFDISVDQFREIEHGTSSGLRLRGNVETEISRPVSGDDDVGCGCAYPPEVSDVDVSYSNQIIQSLRTTYNKVAPEMGLGFLPMTSRLNVGSFGVAITHGDDQSLAGWGFAHDRIAATFQNGLREKMSEEGIDIFASSHTCLPVLFQNDRHIVVNNGAAGLANFAASTSGLITRICSNDSLPALPAAYQTSLEHRGEVANVQALTVEFDATVWQQKFLAQWPIGTAAHSSYWQRLSRGTNYSMEMALQHEH
jgi:hypothetical protein